VTTDLNETSPRQEAKSDCRLPVEELVEYFRMENETLAGGQKRSKENRQG
jgi:hypothetical protein